LPYGFYQQTKSLQRLPIDSLKSNSVRAYELRRGQFSESGASATNAFRLFNGEGDRLPGLVCDLYDQTAVLQFDGKGPSEFWDRDLIANWLLETVKVKSVVEKIRRPGADVEPLILIKGEKPKRHHSNP
jgi:23S rRNA G2069 N7-methylase RlmK/C1962 C5-methylase RlmI